MRLWSLHPKYLDSRGLVALWREGLLAQKVLSGNTKGYKHHPQLKRFNETSNPIGAIATYLRYVLREAVSRGYSFDGSKIMNRRFARKISVTDQQIGYEFDHLLKKLQTRDPKLYAKLRPTPRVEMHPLFIQVCGDIEEWEIR
jgi:hypothetical protein